MSCSTTGLSVGNSSQNQQIKQLKVTSCMIRKTRISKIQSAQEFKDSSLSHIRQRSIPSIIIPCWFTQVPSKLGTPKLGKLKASLFFHLCATQPYWFLLLKFDSKTHPNIFINFALLVTFKKVSQWKVKQTGWSLIALHRNFKTSIPIAKYFTESSLNTPPACKTEVVGSCIEYVGVFWQVDQ